MQMGNKEAGKGMEAVWGRRRAAPPPEDDDGEVERSRATKAKNDPLSVYGKPATVLPFFFLLAKNQDSRCAASITDE